MYTSIMYKKMWAISLLPDPTVFDLNCFLHVSPQGSHLNPEITAIQRQIGSRTFHKEQLTEQLEHLVIQLLSSSEFSNNGWGL